jgi:cell division septation protein DedD
VLRSFVLVAVLCATLTACGGEDTAPRKFIAQSRAESLLRSVDRIGSDLDEGKCDSAARAVARLRSQVSDLPESYDGALVSNLSQWVDHLDARVQQDCTDADAEESPTPAPSETPTPEETETPTPTPSPTETPSATPTPSPSPTATPTVPSPSPESGGTGGASPNDEEG